MPNPQHYAASSTTFPQDRHGFAGNPQTASTPSGSSHPPQHQYPAMNQQQQQPNQTASAYPHYMQQAPYPPSQRPGYTNQPVQMPTAPTDRRYAHHPETALAGVQPQFPQPRYAETYPHCGYPAGNMQPVYGTSYPPSDSRGYCQPGSAVSAASGQHGYMNGTYPPMETHYGHPQYPPQVHSSDQVSRVAERPGAYSRNATGFQPESQNFQVTGNTEHAINPSQGSSHRPVACQQARDSEVQRDLSTDGTSSQSKNSARSNVVNHRQTAQRSNPHIVKPAVLHPTSSGNFLYLL